VATVESTLTFDIEGQTVRCVQSGDDRLWRCECEYFQRMLTKHGQGFCPHVAVAVEQAVDRELIDVCKFDDADPACTAERDRKVPPI
jgi:hypothetical protein